MTWRPDPGTQTRHLTAAHPAARPPEAEAPPRKEGASIGNAGNFSEATLHSNTRVNLNPSPFAFQFLERDLSPGQPIFVGRFFFKS